jgi:hypothetical protein
VRVTKVAITAAEAAVRLVAIHIVKESDMTKKRDVKE